MSSVAAVHMVRLEDGRDLCARQWSGTGRRSLVLLHGLLDSSEGWTRVCEATTGTRIAFDLPGFGHSDPPRRGSLAGYARDVAVGLDALGVERFAVVGHSLGGAVAAALTELMPERVEALVLLAPAGFGRIPLAEVVSVPGLSSLVDTALPFLLANGLAVSAGYMAMVSNGMSPERGLIERVTGRGGALVDGFREATRSIAEAGRQRDAFHGRRLSYRGPVYGIWGDRDRLVPSRHSGGLRTAYPHARIEIWRGMGHHATRERFDDLVAVVARATAASRPRTHPSVGLQRKAA
jgi:pimeloyl-ACP methyl ester carboxylesterase